jgi:hypothetical protein
MLALKRLKIASKYPTLYLGMFVHRSKRNTSLDIMGRPYLPPIYKDNSQRIVIMKAVQIGITEWLVCVVMTKTQKGWSVLYVMPTIDLRNDFVADRLDRLFQLVPYYRDGLKQYKDSTDSRGLKHLWGGTAWFTGSNSETAFVSRDADMGIIDELDRCDQEKVAMLPDRLDASEHKFLYKISNPTFSKYAIHKEYLLSDQKEWYVTCPHCGTEQTLDFFVNVVKKIGEAKYELLDKEWTPGCGRDIHVLCHECQQPLDRLGPGRYIAKYPERPISGYHLSQLISPTKSIKEIYEAFVEAQSDQTKMQLFYNSRLGLPYEGVGDKLSAALLEAKCMVDYTMPTTGRACTAGIDVNWPWLHVRISAYDKGVRKAVYIGKVNGWDDLDNLLKRYDVKTSVIDLEPERHKVAEYQKKNKYLWACDYLTNPRPDDIDTYINRAKDNYRNEKGKNIAIDRTQIIDAMVAGILNGKMALPKDFRSIDNKEYVNQLEAPIRKFIDNGKQARYAWDEGGKPDHYFHAEVYDYIASRLFSNTKASDVVSSGNTEFYRELEDFGSFGQ